MLVMVFFGISICTIVLFVLKLIRTNLLIQFSDQRNGSDDTFLHRKLRFVLFLLLYKNLLLLTVGCHNSIKLVVEKFPKNEAPT